MEYRFGYRNIHSPSNEMGVLQDSSSLLDDTAALQQRMKEDGFLLLHGSSSAKKY